MKELSIEQKAKAYDEALEWAKDVIEQNPLMEYLLLLGSNLSKNVFNPQSNQKWKPLGKHLEALTIAINNESLAISVRNDLNELLEQLKQL